MGDVRGSGQGGSNGKANNGSGNKALVIVIIALVVIAILAGVIIYLLVSRKNEEPVAQEPKALTSEEDQRDILITEENVGVMAERLEQQEYVQPGYYTVTQNSEWHFPKGNEASTDAHVENALENTNDVYFDLFFADDDNEENPIYQSPVIPRGAVLEGFKLDKALDAGSYDCIIVYHLVDENQKSISTVRLTVKVIVEG